MIDLYARMEHPNNGWDHDKEAVKKLDSTLYYPVYHVDMGGSFTDIYLTNVSVKQAFNSANFEFYELVDGEYIPYNIFADPDFNPYLGDEE